MPILAADPWSPERGMGFEAALHETRASANPYVETTDWTTPIAPRAAAEPGRLWFVDGVRRIELRLLATEGERRAFGLFGTAAVGAVRCEGRATFAHDEVHRALVLGAGMAAEPVALSLGDARLVFLPAAEPGADANAPLDGLQKLMQAAEANLAARLAADGDALVFADGRLGFLDPTASPVVGVVKRLVRAYLEPAHDALLPRLAPGQRTPLFGLAYEGSGLERFAWYTRLTARRAPFHAHAGILRCEVRAGLGVAEAVAIAERVSALLPGFAGRPSDPRAPQNLVPVGGLEGWLQHRMGHRGLIRRALIAALMGQEG